MKPVGKSEILQQLPEQIRQVSDRRLLDTSHVIQTGWVEVDKGLSQVAQAEAGGLWLGGIHEFLGPVWEESPGRDAEPQYKADAPDQSRCVCLLAHLAARAVEKLDGHVVWVGKRCWPSGCLLARLHVLERSIFVDAVGEADRLWAIDLAIRNSGVACVVGDAHGLKLPATRRLELAAGNRRCLVLLGRPGQERSVRSAASTRWLVSRRLSSSLHPSWKLELVRCKGLQFAQGGPWPLEWNRAKGAVTVSSAVVDRSSSPAAAGFAHFRETGTG